MAKVTKTEQKKIDQDMEKVFRKEVTRLRGGVKVKRLSQKDLGKVVEIAFHDNDEVTTEKGILINVDDDGSGRAFFPRTRNHENWFERDQLVSISDNIFHPCTL